MSSKTSVHVAEIKIRPEYSVPALEKGLDILECLAVQRVPLTQTQLSRALEKGQSELFRMLSCLEKRGYLQRDPVSGAYSLTLRLFELSHMHSPFEQLLRASVRPMQELAEEVRESCHLGVLHKGQLLILGQGESPEKVRLSIEIGSNFSALNTASGRLLLAHHTSEDDDPLTVAPEYRRLSETEKKAFQQRLQKIRARAYEEAYSEYFAGVYDLAVLVGGPASGLQASLTISTLTREAKSDVRKRLLEPLTSCAERIARDAGLFLSA